MTRPATSLFPTDEAPGTGPDRLGRLLLLAGAAAGPLYVVVGALQVMLRSDFDIRHHELSLAANGSHGWIQTLNFLVTGALVVAGAVGASRAWRTGLASKWGPRLIGAYGAGVVGAGLFRADPAYGFPRHTAPGRPAHVSVHGNLHFVVAGLGFIALVVACFVVARRFAAAGRSPWAVYSRVTGVLFIAAFAGVASGSNNTPINLSFTAAVVLGWAWITAVLTSAAHAGTAST